MSQSLARPRLVERTALHAIPSDAGRIDIARPPVGAVERAFELAGQSFKLPEIKARLKQEGYSNVDAYLVGKRIRADLRRVVKRTAGS